MKLCPYCGAKYSDDTARCVIDGTALVIDASTSAPSPNVAVGPDPTGLAISALVLGILSVLLSLFLVGGVFAIVAIALGIVHFRKKRSPTGMASWGIGLGIVGLLATLMLGTFYYRIIKQVRTAMNSPGVTEDDPGRWEGVKAPDLTMTTLDGKQIKLSDFKGKRVVLDFWATWCPPCRKELPHFVKLYEQTSRDKLVIIGISDEAPSKLQNFVRDNGITYPIANGTNLPAPYKNISAIPATFYIDTKGTIQKVAVGYHEYADIRSDALADDFKGEVRDAPLGPRPLADAPVKLKATLLWSNSVASAQALCTGRWRNDGETQILIAAGRTLHVLDADGHEMQTVSLPDTFTIIDCGVGKGNGARLVGYQNWGHSATVMDSRGTKLWDVSALMGIDGAHWGDLDGDGTDELVVGMNGGGGLQLWSNDGKKLWSDNLGNVWNQAIVPAEPGKPGLVLATEAGGTVRLFDPAGKLLSTLRPNGGYYSQMTACRASNEVQIASINKNEVVVFDTAGKVAWTAPTKLDHGGWRKTSFAFGDLEGGRGIDWCFVDGDGDLVIANSRGEKVSSIPGAQIESFAVAPRKGKSGLLITLGNGRVAGYELSK